MTYWWLIGLHVAKGLCFGTIVAVNQPWATERLSDAGKGWASSYAHTGWTFGALMVLLLAKLGVAEGKRALETLTLVPAVFILVIVFFAPESAEWKDESPHYLPYKDLIRNHYGLLSLLAIFWVIVPGVSYIGFYWGPKMLSDFSGKQGVDYDFFMILHGAAILSSLFASTVVDYGRRRVLVIDLLVMAAAFVAIQHAQTTFAWKLSFLVSDACVQFAWTVGPILTSEVFPTVFRARAFGTLQVFVRLSTISGPVITGSLMEDNKAKFLFYGLAVLSLISATAICCVPETIAFAEEMKPFYTPQSITVTPRHLP
jgi:MFS family permease